LLIQRQFNPHVQAAFRAVLQFYTAVVPVDNALNNSQPQTGTNAATRFIALSKRLK